MATYKTPGVYVEEIPTLPPSVAEVSTAVPVFVGYTKHGPKIARITTMLEYQALYGGAKLRSYDITATTSGGKITLSSVTRNAPAGEPAFHLYDAVSMYFKNGGGPCYIASAGGHDTALPDKAGFEDALTLIEQEDEPTLIVLTDAVSLSADDYHSVCQSALQQCADLGDRFAIFDVRERDDGDDHVGEFRTMIGTKNLMYGAAYYPYLQTTMTYDYDEAQVNVTVDSEAAVSLSGMRATQTALYNQIKLALAAERITMPPSAAIAGVYASIDRNRGVWKAPANASLSWVVGPVEKISSKAQEDLNVDPTAGKSINAIRAFTGKGTLVWGARTLAGNDNEWRYISVRRLFNLIEESSRKSTAFAVFEPNDETTWLKVRGMIESYLYRLWEQGALAGTSPEQAYFVSVGLGRTMSEQDVLEGRMIVEIGVAATRPAEFIVLRFTHKLQEA